MRLEGKASLVTGAGSGIAGAIALEFALATAAQNIPVNCLCPGWIETPMLDVLNQMPETLQQIVAQTPMSRMGRPDEVARAAVFLASEDSSFMTGAPLLVDGG